MAGLESERSASYNFVLETAVRNWADYWSWFFPPGVRMLQTMRAFQDVLLNPPSESQVPFGHLED